MLDAHDLAVRLFGDSIAGNMLLLGFAYQIGRVPVSSEAIEQAIELNGVQIEMNRGAFRLGRLAAHDREAFERLAGVPEVPAEPKLKSLDEIIADRKRRLTGYQNAAWAERYAERIARIAEAERRQAPGKSGLAEVAARALYKLMSTKDEYEVARLYTDGTFAREVARTFDGDYTLHVHLAPPLFARKDPVTGLPRKTEFGPWMLRAMRLLAAMKGLRGTMFDVFGMTAERRHERQMLADYERLLDTILARLSVASHATAVELASLPLMVKGFGHVKHANWEKAQTRQSELLFRLDNPSPSPAEPEHAAAA
jgi:indolepyruvate ferredoxin oxidoreductase